MPQTKEATKKKVKGVQQGLGVTDDGVYGPVTRGALMQSFAPRMNEAVKFAENNKRNHGVLSIPTSSAEEASAILRNSVRNNLDRFMHGKQSNENYDNSGTPRFVDFMQQKWAPLEDPRDVNHLNKNWAPNVRWYLQKKYPQQYQDWKRMNLVQSPMEQFEVMA